MIRFPANDRLFVRKRLCFNTTQPALRDRYDKIARHLYYFATDPNADPNIRPRQQLLWRMERKAEGWGPSKRVDDLVPLRPGKVIMRLAFTTSGNIYFDMGGPDEKGQWKWEVWWRPMKEGKLQAAERVPGPVNAGDINWTPFVAPDESYLIVSSSRMNNGDSGDHYISFRQADGSWGDPVSMGSTVNTSEYQERFPAVSPDGKYFFFARSVPETYSDVYWVSTKLIEELRAEASSAK